MRAFMRIATLAVALPAALPAADAPHTVSAAGHGHHGVAEHATGAARFPQPFQRFVREMDRGMLKMMEDMHAPGYTGDPDVDFLAMMIPHHQGAVDMARLVLIHGQDPLTRQLAEEIIAGQQAEIMAMKVRLGILRKGVDSDPGGYPALTGLRGARPAQINGHGGE